MSKVMFMLMIGLLAFGLLSPIFLVVRRFLNPLTHGRQRTAVLSLFCFLSGTLLFSICNVWRATSSLGSIQASNESLRVSLQAQRVTVPGDLSTVTTEAVESAKNDVAQSIWLLRSIVADALIIFLCYYGVLLLLAWIAGYMRRPVSETVASSPSAEPSFLARACMVLVLMIGGYGLLGNLAIARGGELFTSDFVALFSLNLGAPALAALLYYLFKGLPREADRDFALQMVAPTLCWCLIPTLSILSRFLVFGFPKR